jgi:hypothetical protein
MFVKKNKWAFNNETKKKIPKCIYLDQFFLQNDKNLIYIYDHCKIILYMH